MALGRIQRVKIDLTAGGAGDNQLVAAIPASGNPGSINYTPGLKIAVLAAVLTMSAAGMNPKFRSNANDISGPLYLALNGGIVLPMMGDDDEVAWAVTNAGETLNLNVAAAGSIGGFLVYKTGW